MSSLPPFQMQSAGGAATLENATLRYWFASLGAVCEATPAASATPSRRSTQAGTTSAKRCSHPDRCRFSGCQRDCHSPLPAA